MSIVRENGTCNHDDCFLYKIIKVALKMHSLKGFNYDINNK